MADDPLPEVLGLVSCEREGRARREVLRDGGEAGVPGVQIRFGFGLAVEFAARGVPGVPAEVEQVERAVVLVLRAGEDTDAPGQEALPVDAAGQSLEVLLP